MIKTVIFDLDDTLISEKKYIESGYHHISKLLSVRFEKNEFELYQLLISLFNESPKNVFNRLFDKLGITYSNNDILEIVEEYRSHLPNIGLFDDVIPCLEELRWKGLKLGIITDGYANAQRQKLKAVKAYDYFDETIVTDELGTEFWKPHSKAFELMKDKLNMEFNEMVYVGDNITKDFVTPNRLGMQTVHILRDNGIYNLNKDLYEPDFEAQYCIKNMYHLLKLLELESI